MKKIRIGNDINIAIQVTQNGEAFDITGKQLRLLLRTGIIKIEITDYIIKNNVILFTFTGKKQRHKGSYFFTLYEEDEEKQNVADSIDVFELVSRSTTSNSTDDCMNVKTESIELSLNVITEGIIDTKTTDYNDLDNKPSINGIKIEGNKTPKEYGLVPEKALDDLATKKLVDTRTTEYNVSVQFPTGGVDGTNKYTLELAIAKVPSELRTIGLKCSFLNEEGMITYEFTGTDKNQWETTTLWQRIVNELNLSKNTFVKNEKYNAYIKELYISGDDIDSIVFEVVRMGYTEANSTFFFIIIDSNLKEYYISKNEDRKTASSYHKFIIKGIMFEFIINFIDIPFNWNSGFLPANGSNIITGRAFSLSYNPYISDMRNKEEQSFINKDLTIDIKRNRDILTPFDIEIIKGGYYTNGNTFQSYTEGFYTEIYYPINNFFRYKYNGQSFYQIPSLIFYDKHLKFITNFPSTINYNKRITGWIDEITSIPENAFYIRFCSYQKMLIEIERFYIAKDEFRLSSNKLIGKSAIFNGDSVMEGFGGAEYGGWPKLIGEMNQMVWLNKGVGGTTLRVQEGKQSSILERQKAIPLTYDYYILSGGFNDITSLTPEVTKGVITSGFTGPFDENTTLGAMEALCKYALTTYSEKKVGFIIPYNISGWDTWADDLIKICNKWSMPFIDMRKCSGFTLQSSDLRKLYGVYKGSISSYNPDSGYILDQRVKFNGTIYKAKQEIPAPANEFNPDKWVHTITDDVYDDWHCNVLGYQVSYTKIEAWMKTL